MMTARLLLLPCLASTGTLLAAPPPESYPCQNGLVRSLVAREPMFINPVAVAVDADGAIYVTETTRRKVADLDIREVMGWVAEDLSHTTVEQKRDFFHKAITDENFKNHPSLKDHNKDGRIDWQDLTVHSEKIHKLVDTDGDGMADRATVFAEDFNTEVTGIAAGVLARHGDVYATIAPDVWKLRDTNGDGKADERKAIATGFGIHINYAGHDMHGLTFGPDGKLYWTIGDKGTNASSETRRYFYPHEGALLRCNPDGSNFEVYARGLRNVQQIAFDDYGNIFGVDNDSDQKGEKERLLYIVEGSDSGWRCYYQYRGGKYNPWMDERIAFPDGPDRPASILPPLSLYLDGPSGFAYNPGTALNERYRGHFFLTQFPAGKINAFKMEPDGAAYKMTDDHLMASGTAFTGCNFGPDGALYVADWQGGYPLKEKGALWKIDDPKEAGSAMRKEVAGLLNGGIQRLREDQLLPLFSYPDQRVRLEAQWRLAALSKAWPRVWAEPVAPIFKGQSLIAKVHALWLLSQIQVFDRSLFDQLAKDPEPEIRAQAAKWAGETFRFSAPFPPLVALLLKDPSPRVRFHAAMAIGKGGTHDDIGAVAAMLAENDGRDAYLSHAGSFALRGAAERPPGQGGRLRSLVHHPSAAVRTALIVALRHKCQTGEKGLNERRMQVPPRAADQETLEMLEELLGDADPNVAAEAARTVYENLVCREDFPALAAMLEKTPDARESVIRRSIAANRRVGDEACLFRLIRFAGNPAASMEMRILALETLAGIRTQETLDPVDGHYAPARPLEVYAERASRLSELLAPLAMDQALAKPATAALDAIGMKPDPASLASQALTPSLHTDLRIRALRKLQEADDPKWPEIAAAMLKDSSTDLRIKAAPLIAEKAPDLALSYLEGALKTGDYEERQAVFNLLGQIPGEKADQLLSRAINRLSPQNNWGDQKVLLEALEAGHRREACRDLTAKKESEIATNTPGGKNAYLFAGGNSRRGEEIFEKNLAANCMACHRIRQVGSNVGPPLKGIGQKGMAYLHQSLVDPQASVAPGYGMMTLTKKGGSSLAGAFVEEKDGALVLQLVDGSKASVPLADIATKTPPVSAMPPMGEVLTTRELRDLLDYLSILK